MLLSNIVTILEEIARRQQEHTLDHIYALSVIVPLGVLFDEHFFDPIAKSALMTRATETLRAISTKVDACEHQKVPISSVPTVRHHPPWFIFSPAGPRQLRDCVPGQSQCHLHLIAITVQQSHTTLKNLSYNSHHFFFYPEHPFFIFCKKCELGFFSFGTAPVQGTTVQPVPQPTRLATAPFRPSPPHAETPGAPTLRFQFRFSSLCFIPPSSTTALVSLEFLNSHFKIVVSGVRSGNGGCSKLTRQVYKARGEGMSRLGSLSCTAWARTWTALSVSPNTSSCCPSANTASIRAGSIAVAVSRYPRPRCRPANTVMSSSASSTYPMYLHAVAICQGTHAVSGDTFR